MKKPISRTTSHERRDHSEKSAENRAVTERIERLESQLEMLAWKSFYEPAVSSSRLDPQAFTAQTKYVRSTTEGWLVVLVNGARTSLPSGLKVSLISSSQGRDYGIVSEGVLLGTNFNVASGNLVDTYKRLANLKIKVRKRAGGAVVIDTISYDLELSVTYKDGTVSKTTGPFPALTDTADPVPQGDHDIEIADYPHPWGAPYGPVGTVWFRIGHSGPRYLHPGKVSDGCLTCAPGNWVEIHGIVHCARVNTVTTGTMNVSTTQ